MSNDGKRKLGRKLKADSDEKMTKVSFLMDVDTEAMFEELGASMGAPQIRGWRSILLRKLIHGAHSESKK